MDVGQDTTSSDGDFAQQLAQLLVVPDGQLQVTGDDPVLLVVTSSITSQLKQLGSEVLEHGCQVHRGTSTHALGIAALLQETGDTAHRELKTSLGTATHGLLGSLALSTSRHG